MNLQSLPYELAQLTCCTRIRSNGIGYQELQVKMHKLHKLFEDGNISEAKALTAPIQVKTLHESGQELSIPAAEETQESSPNSCVAKKILEDKIREDERQAKEWIQTIHNYNFACHSNTRFIKDAHFKHTKD
jgi:hypothetical protein